ncbi:MAG: cytochrome c peroxidase [Exilibacterium sp.]
MFDFEKHLISISLIVLLLITACDEKDDIFNDNSNTNPEPPSALDSTLREIINKNGLTGDAAAGRNLPSIEDPLAQLGKQLYFTKALGGVQDAACVSCHHPVLGGGDNLSLSVGVDAVDEIGSPAPDLLGLGRYHKLVVNVEPQEFLPAVGRNAPSTFNLGLWDSSMLWDSRIESADPVIGANGENVGIITPDTRPDANVNLPSDFNLVATQALFPVLSAAVMRKDFLSEAPGEEVRKALAQRLSTQGSWVDAFVVVFGDTEINYERIARAIGAYERSQVFINSPWKAYVEGQTDALTEDQKQGALLFFTSVSEGGAGCNTCHSGDFFTNEEDAVAAFPQLRDDRGRGGISGDTAEDYSFRTPTLLNIAVTGPYGHSGTYATLEEVVRHYMNPRGNIETLFGAVNGVQFVEAAGLCNLPQFSLLEAATGTACEDWYPDAYSISITALEAFETNPSFDSPQLSDVQVRQLVAFLEALTDSCVTDRECLDPWIIDEDDLESFPDNQALIAVDIEGNAL